MRVFTYIGNVVTGRFAHWNDANNQTIAEMWERSQEFPEHVRIPFQDFIVCCTSLMDVLLGPDKGRQRLITAFPRICFPFSPNFSLGRKSAAVRGGGDAEELEDAALEGG